MTASRLVLPGTHREPRQEKVRDFRRRPWRRKPADQVSHATRLEVLQRDRICFAFRLYGSDHQCQDHIGLHQPTELDRLTLDHVHLDGATMGKRAPSDAWHLVACCQQWNCKPPSHAEREAERAYLAALKA